MNMHGFMTPVEERDPERSRVERAWDWARQRRWFMLGVVVPSLLVAIYLFAFASDQYESEAHFLVRSANGTMTPSTGVGAALSLVTGSASQNEAMGVADYLTSHDAVARLRKDDRLVERFHRPGVDLLSRLWSDNPTPERLLRYYRQQVQVKFNTETGISVIRVRSFVPDDSYAITRRLLEIGEQRVNTLNERSYRDEMANAQRQLVDAERALAVSDAQMTAFRRNRGDIDPQASGAAQLGLVSGLTAELAKARAQLNAMGGMISPSSPQYQALAAHVQALQVQVNAQSGKLAGSSGAIANDISGYQALQLRREFLGKTYEAAAASVQKAREQAQQQQLYLVRVVEPNMPVKSTYPERWRILATVVIGLLLAYSIGWLIVAGVREHAA